ncbi:sugar phosphate isomerase/epimerase family protein [Neomoorella thermoacetica]|uniref:sugar phosphate isomerase/epimerase family protein n=1 Tax=Neomoorella thermoacetica TaxID=1525 RepID=UPI0008FA2DC7|nr:sugar phosphate isomerase/epimerase [Moorella thermoacetica]OIQ11010.1 inosose isomerase [Moorella thermoacetica]
MKLCFNEGTTMKNSTLELDLELCNKYRYDLIEIRVDQLNSYLERHSLNDLIKFFNEHQIKPYSFNTLEFVTFRDAIDYKKIKDDLVYLCETGTKINCRNIVVVPSFDVPYTKRQIKEETVRVLNDLADVAEKYHINLAFEFVGYPNCSVNTFEQAYEIVTAVNRENVGMVLDCFHFHSMNSKIEALKKADPNKIFIFHIDDAEDLPVGALRDNNRLWPGDGSIDLDLILKTLKEIGYDRMASVELFREEYWKWEPEKTIKVAKEKTEAVIKKYFTT